MAGSFSDLCVHVVFATKHRQSWILPERRELLHAYLGGCVRGQGATPLAVGGVVDHVHLLVGHKPSLAVSDLVRETKKASTAWVRTEFRLPPFAWQEGYAAFSIGRSEREATRAYILNQEAHHHGEDPLGELERLLREAGVEFDPRLIE